MRRSPKSRPTRSLLEQLDDWVPRPAHVEPLELGLRLRRALLRAAGIEHDEPPDRGRVLVELLRRVSARAQISLQAAPDFADRRDGLRGVAQVLRALSVITERWTENGGPGRGHENDYRRPLWTLLSTRFRVPQSRMGMPTVYVYEADGVDILSSARSDGSFQVRDISDEIPVSANSGARVLDSAVVVAELEHAVRLEPDLLPRLLAGFEAAVARLVKEMDEVQAAGRPTEALRNREIADLAFVFGAVHGFARPTAQLRATFVHAALRALGMAPPDLATVKSIIDNEPLAWVARKKPVPIGRVPPRWVTDFAPILHALEAGVVFGHDADADARRAILRSLATRLRGASHLVETPPTAASGKRRRSDP